MRSKVPSLPVVARLNLVPFSWKLYHAMYSSFTEVLVGCIEECVPKKMVSLTDKKSNPHWMNEEVKLKRTELNRAKKKI